MKKIAGYHQFDAINRAIETTIAASDTKGDRRAGVVWRRMEPGNRAAGAIRVVSVIEGGRIINKHTTTEQVVGDMVIGVGVGI